MSDNRGAIPGGTVLEIVAEGRQVIAKYRAILPDANLHPTWYALVTEYCRRYEVVIVELEAGREPSTLALAAMNELRSWVIADEDRPDEFANSLVRHGMTYTETTEMLRHLKSKSKGRPAGGVRRDIFISAYEMKQRGASPWQATAALCDCDPATWPLHRRNRNIQKRARHDKACEDAIKAGIQAVSRLLAKYQLPAC